MDRKLGIIRGTVIGKRTKPLNIEKSNKRKKIEEDDNKNGLVNGPIFQSSYREIEDDWEIISDYVSGDDL